MITNLGLFFSLLSLVMVICFAIVKSGNIQTEVFVFNANVQGWTSIIIAISFFSGLILFSLGIMSEYIFRIYEEVKARPGYIIRKKPEQE